MQGRIDASLSLVHALNGKRLGTHLTAAGSSTPGQFCETARKVLGIAGTGIMLSSGGRPVCSASAGQMGELIEDLQYSLVEGPSLDADRLGIAVLEPHLAHPGSSRWLAFTGPALNAGVEAVFAFPLRHAETSLGALGLYASRPGPLSDHQNGDALMMAAIAARTLHAMAWPSGGITDAGWDFRPVVNQAAGMVAAQLEIDVDDALARVRAHALGSGRLVGEVAADIIARRLRMSADAE